MNVFYRLKNSVETIAESCWSKLSPEHKEYFEEAPDATEHTHQVTEKEGQAHLTHATNPAVASVAMSSLAAGL